MYHQDLFHAPHIVASKIPIQLIMMDRVVSLWTQFLNDIFTLISALAQLKGYDFSWHVYLTAGCWMLDDELSGTSWKNGLLSVV
jgi:hypothetical protein